MTLRVGAHVRHRKQPAWGIGAVTSVGTQGPHVALVIAFEGAGEKRLRVPSASLAEIFEVVPQSEVDARNEAIAAEVAAAGKAERKERVAQRKAQGPTRTITPFHVVNAGYGGVHAMADGTLVAAVSQEGASGALLCIYDARGDDASIVAQIELPESAPRDTLGVAGDLIFGSSNNSWYQLTFARVRDAVARVWHAAEQRGVPRYEPAPGAGVVVYDLHRIQLAHEDGTTADVPWVPPGKRSIHSVRWWDYDLLVGAGGDSPDGPYHAWACVAGDGAQRFGGFGATPIPISRDLALVFEHEQTRAIDRDGNIVATLPMGVSFPESISHRERAQFASCDDDVVLCRSHEGSVVRWNPRTSAPTWHTRLADQRVPLVPPVRVGACIAVTTSEYAEADQRIVWILDAASGRVLHELPMRSAVTDLCAVGDDVLVACSYVKNVPAWRNLTGKLERMTLQNEGKVFDVCSPSKDVVVTRDGDRLSFFRM